MGLKIVGKIEKVNGKELSYGEFAKKYMEKNQPVVLTGLMDDWRACKDWVTPDGQPNLHFFSTHFGKSKVQVADCNTREFTDQKRAEMSVSNFIDQWMNYNDCDHTSTSVVDSNPLLYLKDWHFVNEYPAYLAYTTPLFFCDDWLNLYLDYHHMHEDPDASEEKNDISCSDYRFVYMGAKGSWTPLHADVVRSYSWSANVCGKKQWLFLTPTQRQLVFDRNDKNSVYDIFGDVSDKTFPGFKEALWLECIQEQNEIIFVPSGWYHQVHNLEDTISINHNWFNAYNLSWIWDLLVKEYNEAKEYIEDIRDICDDFEGLCQRNLAANAGMNFDDFFAFIARFAFANVVQLYNLLMEEKSPSGIVHPLTSHLAALNLDCIRQIAQKMESAEALAESHKTLDLTEMLNDPKFLGMCNALHKRYSTIHELKSCSAQEFEAWTHAFRDSNCSKFCSRVSAPQHLVNFVDHALAEVKDFLYQ